MLTLFVLFVGLTLATAVIAYWSDNLGKKLGKKRVSLWNMRPRTTATFLTIASSWVIMTFTLVVLLIVWAPLRQSLLRYQTVKAQEQILRKSAGELKKTIGDLNGRIAQLTAQTKNAQQSLAGVQQQLDDAQKAAQKAGKEREIAVNSARLAQQSARVAASRASEAARNERAAQANLKSVSAQLGATQAQKQAAQAQYNRAKTQLRNAQTEVGKATIQVQKANAEVEKANRNVEKANAKFEAAQSKLAQAQGDLLLAKNSEEKSLANATAAEKRARDAQKQVRESYKQVLVLDEQVIEAQKQVDELEKQANAFYLSDVRVPVNRTIAAQSFDQTPSFSQARDQLRGLFNRAGTEIVPKMLPGATLELRSFLNVGQSDAVELSPDEIYNNLATVISRSRDALSVRLISARNHRLGDKELEARFVVVPIRTALETDSELASADVDGRASDARLFSALVSLVDEARETASSRGVTPPLSPEMPTFYAPGANEQLFQTLRAINTLKGPARVRILALQPISTVDQLRVRFEIEALDPRTAPTPPSLLPSVPAS